MTKKNFFASECYTAIVQMIIVFKENSTIVLEALPIHIKILLMLGLILVINNTETVKKY